MGLEFVRIFMIHLGDAICRDEHTLQNTISKILVSTLMLSYSIRRNTALCIDVCRSYTVCANGKEIKHLYADESSSKGLIRALFKRGKLPGLSIESSCGYSALCRCTIDLRDILRDNLRLCSEVPICVEVTVGEPYLEVDNVSIALWSALAIANIVLDNASIPS